MTRLFEYVADAFEAEGVSTIFGLMGDGNMLWLAEMASRSSVRVIHGRHEAATLAMADGWAQASSEVAVCSVTCGPGVTNLVTSLRVAAHNRTPMVVLAGDTPVGVATHYQQFDIGNLQTSAGVPVLAVRSAAEAPAKIRAAFATARRDRCPVVLGVPYDLAEQDCELEPYVVSSTAEVSRAASVSDVEAVREQLDGAQKVLLLIGRGAVASNSLDLIKSLAARLVARTGTTVKALGALHELESDLGVVGGFSSPAVRQEIADCDVVLALGASLSFFTTLDGALLAPERTVQVVDRADAWDPGYVFEPAMRVVADCHQFLEQLLPLMGEEGPEPMSIAQRESSTALPTSGVELEPGDGLDPVEVLATFRRALNQPVQLLVGAGHFWNHVIEMPEPPAPVALQIHNGFGAIAHAFPAAVGAAVAAPDLPTLVIEGDGSLMMNVQELETVTRSGIALLVLVINDGAYGAEFHKLAATGMKADESVFGHVDFEGVAAAFGCRARTPGNLTELTEAIGEFLADPAPTVVDVRVSRRVLAGRYRDSYPQTEGKDGITGDGR